MRDYGQGFQLLAVTHHLAATAPVGQDRNLEELVVAARALRAARHVFQPYTTLARPSVEFVDASRVLYEALTHVQQAITTGMPLDHQRAHTDLQTATSTVTSLLSRHAVQPVTLSRAGTLYAAAKALAPDETRLSARNRGATVAAQPADVSHLQYLWSRPLHDLHRLTGRDLAPPHEVHTTPRRESPSRTGFGPGVA